ncbi:hypothetical protein [Pontimicrobium sp. IMCC45349]|uniref:hypothetical protein n=1 Tax=Pontimicrobium sp. IMCC45349 TaxID=3391574 RepID=UPI0039A14D2F
MKKITVLLFFFALLISCKEQPKTNEIKDVSVEVLEKQYPENISKIFEAHGGIDQWNKMKSLEFTMPNDNGDETTLTDLKSRKSLITMPKHTIGFDGKDVWLQNLDTISYKGNAKFYYNLMFYFYAMPFVLGDDGITYTETEALQFEGKMYPGIKIAYNAGVGESPDDEYVLYYDSETNKMAWLGYTVTYFSKEKSKKFNYIRYTDWEQTKGLLLPTNIEWYNYENGKITTKRSSVVFQNNSLSEEETDASEFMRPKEANIIE